MKYLTLEYDVNRPVKKAVSVPLDSECGIGVRVMKDGEAVEGADIGVDGLSAGNPAEHAGYKTFVFGSGSVPSKRVLGVKVSKGGTQDVGSVHLNLTKRGSANREWHPDFSTAGKQLSAVTEWLGDEIELSPTQLVCDFELSCCLNDGTVLSTFSMPGTYKYSLNNGFTEYHNVDGERWEDNQGNAFDKIEILSWNETIVKTNTGLNWGTSDVMRTGYCGMTLKFRQGGSESLSAEFQLEVSETDLGFARLG